MSDIWIPGSQCHGRNPCQNNTGGAMLEVIMALVLGLILIESVLQLTLVGINNIVNAGQRTTACTYADSLLEEMKARPDLLQGVSITTTVRASDLAFSLPEPENLQATIQLLPMEETTGLCQVNVRVISTKGSRSWEENVTSLIPTPQVQE